MGYIKTGGIGRIPLTPEESKTIVGTDRLTWRQTDDRWCLYKGCDQQPLATVVPDSIYAGMYRILLPDGSLSDMVNLTRAKDAAIALALRSFN